MSFKRKLWMVRYNSGDIELWGKKPTIKEAYNLQIQSWIYGTALVSIDNNNNNNISVHFNGEDISKNFNLY